MPEVSDLLFQALRDALNRDHPDNVRARNGYPIITANIPASIWNVIRDEMAASNPSSTENSADDTVRLGDVYRYRLGYDGKAVKLPD